MTGSDDMVLALAAQIVSAHVSSNTMPAADLPRLIQEVIVALRAALQAAETPERLKPAVSIQQSVEHDSIACLECGKRFRTLKRHLEREHAMNELDYRGRWKLPASYKLSAPEYTAFRSEVARKIGLGRRPRARPRRAGRPAGKT